jgi:hypothetical protein
VKRFFSVWCMTTVLASHDDWSLASRICHRRKKQRRWYSGKKKRHTLKFQLLICTVTQRILGTATSAGAVHDLKRFRQSGVRLPNDTALIGDAGYQGLWRSHGHAITTHAYARPFGPPALS